MKARQVDAVFDEITERQGLDARTKRLASMKADPAEERGTRRQVKDGDPRIRQAVVLAKRGLNYSDIGRLVNLSESQVSYHARLAGVRRPGNITNKERERRKRMFEAELARQKGRGA